MRRTLLLGLIAVAGFALAAAQNHCTAPRADAALARAASGLPVYDADLTPHWPGGADWPVRTQFPEFSLTDQAGANVTRADLDRHIVLASFFFTGCSDLCPRLRDSMMTVRRAFPGDTRLLLLSHSVTPQRDGAAMLAAYARSNGIDGRGWRLLTGPRGTIERLEYQGYFVPHPRAEAGPALHSELLVLLDGQQRVRGVYNGTLRTQIADLIRDVRALESEEEGS